jgi:hypothetical protein
VAGDDALRQISFGSVSEVPDLQAAADAEAASRRLRPGVIKPGTRRCNVEFETHLTWRELLALSGKVIVACDARGAPISTSARNRATLEREPCKPINRGCPGLYVAMSNGHAGFYGAVDAPGDWEDTNNWLYYEDPA